VSCRWLANGLLGSMVSRCGWDGGWKFDFVAEVMVDGGWECYIVTEVVADNDGCGCVAEAEGWH
jgi:hypothetical protein